MKRLLLLCAWPLACGLPSVASGQDEAMKPLPMPWSPKAPSLVDLSGLVDKPAGRDGFVRVKDGHLVTGGGKRLRIWGVNLTGGACYPRKEDAPAYAAYLARFGVNAVRLHFLDSNWGAGAGIFPTKGDTTRRLDPGQLDRLDWFIHQLKAHGVYVNINLNVGRVFRKGDGVADFEYTGLGKSVTYFDDRIAELHREYATQLLTHRNPYTKAEYRREPAVATVELVNENSLVESWFSGRLRGKLTRKNPGNWTDISDHYARQLTRMFNEHLAQRYPAKALAEWRTWAKVDPGQPIPRLQPEQFDKAPADRFAAEAEFYMGLETRYFLGMRRHLRALGVQAPLVATSDHNHWKSGYPLVSSTSRLDIVDGHVYWQHPRKTRDPKTGRAGFWIGNSPMVNDPMRSTVVQLSRSAVAGKPYTVSEVNHPFPNEYACEGLPVLTAYALLQDWDGIYWYTFAHGAPHDWPARRPGHFDLQPEPVKMAQLAACGTMFLRGDVAPARKTVLRSYSRRQVIESLRLPSGANSPLFTPGFSRALPLVHATRVDSFDRGKSDYPALDVPEEIVSDTGELTWHRREGKGLLAIETGRSQGLIGYVGGTWRATGNLRVRVDQAFCAVLLTSLDGKPLSRSGRMLLTAGGRTALTGMRWDEKRHTLTAWGKPPMRIEPITGTVALAGRDDGAGELEMVALDGAGAPGAEPARGQIAGKETRFRLDQPTVWYLIRAKP